jgi:hypothetical protein
MRQHVDETRRDGETLCVNDRGRSRATQISDSGDAIAFDPDVGPDGRAAGAVINSSVSDDDVEGLSLSLRRRGQRYSQNKHDGE